MITEEEGGVHTILRQVETESENYYEAKKAATSAYPDANIREIEREKSFVVDILHKRHSKLPGAMVASDWEINFILKITASESNIQISFEKLGNLKWEGGDLIFPTAGANIMMTMYRHIFNSKGEVAKGLKKAKLLYEEIANGIVRDIEKNISVISQMENNIK